MPYHIHTGKYSPISLAEFEACSKLTPNDLALVIGPLGAPALVDSRSAEEGACILLVYVSAAESLNHHRRATKNIGLTAELLYVAGELADFEKTIQIYPEAAAHILDIEFSTTPEILELAQYKTRSILSKVAAHAALP